LIALLDEAARSSFRCLSVKVIKLSISHVLVALPSES
jgi:hypothetical protein